MQTVTQAFKNITTADVNEPEHNLKVSWLRNENSSAEFAVVGTSLVGGLDFVQGENDVLTPTDLFEFMDESDYAMDIALERYVVEPLGGILYAKADVVLDNTAKRFSPDYNSTIGTALLSLRPIKINLGYYVDNIAKLLPKFKGLLNSKPRGDKLSNVVRLEAFDYMHFLDNKVLQSAIYENKRIDEVIEDILIDSGFSATQYQLDEGLNVIGFAWFEKNQTAGKRIRELCESEEATFYQDENGVLRLENRRIYIEPSYSSVVHTVDASDIIRWSESDDRRYNRCTVKAKPREVLSNRDVWAGYSVEPTPAGGEVEFFVTFEDPVTTVITPVANIDYKANTAADGTGTDVTSFVTIAVDGLFTTSAKLVVTNSYGQDIYFVDTQGNSFMKLRGTPAVIQSEIIETYEDVDIRDSYGETSTLVIENDFIDDPSFAYYLARALVRKYKSSVRRIKIEVPAIPHLQLKDLIEVEDPETNTYLNYRVVGITDQMRGAAYTQTLLLRESTPSESDSPAIVGTSTVDSADIVWI